MLKKRRRLALSAETVRARPRADLLYDLDRDGQHRAAGLHGADERVPGPELAAAVRPGLGRLLSDG